MSTVDKATADKIVAGEFPEDGWVRIVEYDNAWGGIGYGCETKQTLGKYSPSDYVRNPRTYWSAVEEKTVVLIDGQYGVYIPQMFAKSYIEDKRWIGMEEGDIKVLLIGPDGPEYWDAWDQVMDKAHYVDKDGRDWKLWQDGDLFAYTGDGDQWV